MATEAVLKRQMSELSATFPGAAMRPLPDGTHVVSVSMTLAPGWSQDLAEVEFIVPVPYPTAQPDCFFANENLRLASGAVPSNSGQQLLEGKNRLWFSWHLQTPWLPARHTLVTYAHFIAERFRRAH
ncbi:E2/UBC family protein [Phycicoccus sp.]|uniref:E2/UBC family protein n=1 Tax=Phycicoccus sp. TaxID=1902410 RepID=UPI002D0EC436|nr:E2/UBC family protein [Phycicoccus sp.]HMM95059.1 E2/UBC family protein [Phycicoccus sp.]